MLSMSHYDDLKSWQYYTAFGCSGLMMFCNMLLLLISLGKWTVAAAPLIITTMFSSWSTVPVAVVFAIMFAASIAAWTFSFIGFGLNYFELPACKTYVFYANMTN